MHSITKDKVICAVVLLRFGSEALLQLRDEKPGLTASGLWVFPGGHINQGEGLKSCAHREFLEETGYECDNLSWLVSINDVFISPVPYPMHVFWDSYDHSKSYSCFEGQALEFIPRNKANDLKVPDYLISIWDLAILAKKFESFYSAERTTGLITNSYFK